MAERKIGTGERLLYLDFLRVLSAVCVVMVHVSSPGMKAYIGSLEWLNANIYDGIAHFCVPVFIMISGAFLLDPEREYSLTKLYKSKILRVVTAFVFWSGFYAVINAFKRNLPFGKKFILEFLTDFIMGERHLWFLFTIAFLYMITPFLRKITQDKRMTEYFLVLCVAFMFGLYNIGAFALHGRIDKISAYVNENINMHFVLGFTFYYVAGYYLKQFSLSRRLRILLYVMGVISAVVIPLGTYYYSVKIGANFLTFYRYHSPPIGLLSVSIFVLFKDLFSGIKSDSRTAEVVSSFSKYSFGIYLVQSAFIDFFYYIIKKVWATDYLFNPILSVPVITLAVLIISTATVWLIGKIPVLNKYII